MGILCYLYINADNKYNDVSLSILALRFLGVNKLSAPTVESTAVIPDRSNTLRRFVGNRRKAREGQTICKHVEMCELLCIGGNVVDLQHIYSH